jgi:hypothetical protein
MERGGWETDKGLTWPIGRKGGLDRYVYFENIANEQKEQYLKSLFDSAETNRLSDQDSSAGKVDAELARARDLRDVSSMASRDPGVEAEQAARPVPKRAGGTVSRQQAGQPGC